MAGSSNDATMGLSNVQALRTAIEAGQTGMHRHGSAERDSRSTARAASMGPMNAERERDRERDRPRRGTSPVPQPQFVRFNSVGQQETMDWLGALESVNNRLDTIERNLRSTNTSLTQTTEFLSKKVLTHIAERDADIVAYKDYVEKRFGTIETVTMRELSKIDIEKIASNFETLQQRCKMTEAMLESLTDAFSKFSGQPTPQPRVQRHEMSTPPHGHNQYGRAEAPPTVSFGDDIDVVDGQQVYTEPMAPPMASTPQNVGAPPMPQSFNNDGPARFNLSSPAVERQGRYNPHADDAQPSPFGDRSYMPGATVKDFDISYKPNPQLKVFHETVAEYSLWSERAADHIARHNHRWRDILGYIKLWGEKRITKAELLATHCDGINAWVLSTKLEAWLADWMGTNL